ncbi:MAG: hypothetical protein H6Q36_1740 [Chloroflexi bacterium]|nr:hypothetical protein [Chloroflexota bacterium]
MAAVGGFRRPDRERGTGGARGHRFTAAAGWLGVALLVAACGGATASPSPMATLDASFPAASFTGGSARASLTVGGGEPIRFTGGWCERPSGGAWLAVNIGDPNGAEYFGLLVGRHPYGGSDASPVASGGIFGDASTVIDWRHGGTDVSLEHGSVTVELGAGARDGTFTGRLPDGSEVAGDFSC